MKKTASSLEPREYIFPSSGPIPRYLSKREQAIDAAVRKALYWPDGFTWHFVRMKVICNIPLGAQVLNWVRDEFSKIMAAQ